MSNETPKFESALGTYEMDRNEVKAVEFAHDPVAYLQKHIETIAQIWPEEEIAFGVIDEIEAMAEYVISDQLQTENEHLKTFLTGRETPDGRRALFALLKEVGMTYAQVLTWVKVESDEPSAEEKLRERADTVYLHEIYGRPE